MKTTIEFLVLPFKHLGGEPYVREEELAKQFGQALWVIQINDRVLDWLITALRSSFKDEKRFLQQAIARLQSEHTRMQQRIDTMYEDRLDRRLTYPA